MIGPKRFLDNFSQSWGALRITAKFGLAFILLLSILLMQIIIAGAALGIAWEANTSIQESTEIQRLAMVMSRNWETVRRLEQSFFIQAPLIGADQAYQLYALPASGKIAEVVRDGAKLKRLSSEAEAGDPRRGWDADVSMFLSTVSQYATLFDEATEFELKLWTAQTGQHAQLGQKAEALEASLRAASQAEDLLALYYQVRYYEQNYLTIQQETESRPVMEKLALLGETIEAGTLPAEQKTAMLTALADYAGILEEIIATDAQIQAKLSELDALGPSVEPNLIDLLVAVETEVGQARLQIQQARQLAMRLLVASMISGLLFSGVIAIILHHSVTRNIIALTQVASQFQHGNLEARLRFKRSDELGQLGRTFNDMAEALAGRIKEVEDLHGILREQAIRDALTGLFNRRYLDETLPRELARAGREGIPVCLVMIDIDRFKRVNDGYGHAVGDKMLQELGAILTAHSRLGDIACRYGGEEFVILLLDARLADGARRAEEWRRRFNAVVVASAGTQVQTTLSAGVVQWNPGETYDELLARVDAALYEAKNAGRNRVAAPGLS